MAGLVEETTRYLVFKVLAKKRSLMTSDIVAYGLDMALVNLSCLEWWAYSLTSLFYRPSIQGRPVSYLQLL